MSGRNQKKKRLVCSQSASNTKIAKSKQAVSCSEADMTSIDWYPLFVEAFGPQCIEKSDPPHDIRFENDDSISGDLITGKWQVIKPNGKERVEIDGEAIGLYGGSIKEVTEALRKQNGDGDWREKLARQVIAEIEAEQAEREAEEARKEGWFCFPAGSKFSDEALARARQILAKRKSEQIGLDGEVADTSDLPGGKAKCPESEPVTGPASPAAAEPDPAPNEAADDDTPESAPTSDVQEYGVFFPDAESAAEFRRYHESKRRHGRSDTPSPTEPIRITSDSQLPEIELTKLTKNGGPLTKRLSLTSDGALVKDGSACVMTRGTAERVKVIGTNALGMLIEDLAPSQAIALGTLRADLPNKIGVVTKDKLVVNGVAQPNIIARTGANITYRGPAFALLDFDSKGMPATVAAELEHAGGFWGALQKVLPALKDTARLTRLSTSAGLSRADTGEVLPGSDGIHLFMAVKDGSDSERF